MAAKIPVQSGAPVLSLNNPTHQTSRSPPKSKINEGVSPSSNLKKGKYVVTIYAEMLQGLSNKGGERLIIGGGLKKLKCITVIVISKQ